MSRERINSNKEQYDLEGAYWDHGGLNAGSRGHSGRRQRIHGQCRGA